MFDIGFGEMILLAVIALIAIGPKQLPEVARVVGRFLNEIKRMTSDFTSTLMDARHSTTQLFQETQEQISKSLTQPTTHVGHDIHHPTDHHVQDPHVHVPHVNDSHGYPHHGEGLSDGHHVPEVRESGTSRSKQLAFAIDSSDHNTDSRSSSAPHVHQASPEADSTVGGDTARNVEKNIVKSTDNKDSGSNGG